MFILHTRYPRVSDSHAQLAVPEADEGVARGSWGSSLTSRDVKSGSSLTPGAVTSGSELEAVSVTLTDFARNRG